MTDAYGLPVRGLLFGAGDRGMNAYGRFALAHPDQFQFTAVAEPQADRREQFARTHHILAEHCYRTWQEALAASRIADVVVNCTQDQMHYSSGMAALQAGYDLLLEKPISPTLNEAVELVQTAKQLGRRMMIGHVLRYTEFFKAVRAILQSDELGQLVTISWRENVAAYHMAHSYVRGNWRTSREAAPMILAKCCHDLDLLTWYLGEPIQELSSTGGLRHFRIENAPAGAPARCTDGCPAEATCPFYAPGIYIQNLPIKYSLMRSDKAYLRQMGKLLVEKPQMMRNFAKVFPGLRAGTEYYGWPRSVITDYPEDEQAVWQALREGPYGRCVYRCDNDVVDHQVVLMTTQSGVSVSLTMHGHSHEEGRTLRIDGSRATLLGKFSLSQTWLEVWDHKGYRREHRRFSTELDQDKSGHGGGDAGLMEAFVRMLQGHADPLTSGRNVLESHLLAFAAEEARLEGSVVRMEAFRGRAGVNNQWAR